MSDFTLPRVVGGYRLEECIGAGSMGTVYRAVQLSLQRDVALKVLRPEYADRADYVERFLREARAVARLNHPNVVSCIDVGEAEGLRYFAMEYAKGTTVGQLLRRGGAFAPPRALRIARQIARALGHAQDAGLVHRDVKPDNILITKDSTAKLCDLGLARERGVVEGRALGTPDYIAPEQARGDETDIRTDLYSLGATLFHMVTGQPPFAGGAAAVLHAHAYEPAPLVTSLDPSIPAGVAQVVARLLAKTPADRYQTPKSLAAALRAELEAPPAKTPRLRTRPRRRR